MNKLFITAVLDEPRRIRFDNRARCKMGELKNPYTVKDLTKPSKQPGAIFAWAWACLYEDHPFESYLDLADAIPEDRIVEVKQALVEAINLAYPDKKKDSEKNGSAESAPSPASNSASAEANGST